MVRGTQNIFLAQLGDPSVTHYFSGISRYMSGRFITMMFGLCGAALAIYHTAKPEHKSSWRINVISCIDIIPNRYN